MPRARPVRHPAAQPRPGAAVTEGLDDGERAPPGGSAKAGGGCDGGAR